MAKNSAQYIIMHMMCAALRAESLGSHIAALRILISSLPVVIHHVLELYRFEKLPSSSVEPGIPWQKVEVLYQSLSLIRFHHHNTTTVMVDRGVGGVPHHQETMFL